MSGYICFLQVNELQAKIKDITRKMMASVSELSMTQAEAVNLQQQVRTKEGELDQAYLRMEQGEAPSQEAARTWERMVRDENRRREDTTMKQMVRLKMWNFKRWSLWYLFWLA